METHGFIGARANDRCLRVERLHGIPHQAASALAWLNTTIATGRTRVLLSITAACIVTKSLSRNLVSFVSRGTFRQFDRLVGYRSIDPAFDADHVFETINLARPTLGLAPDQSSPDAFQLLEASGANGSYG